MPQSKVQYRLIVFCLLLFFLMFILCLFYNKKQVCCQNKKNDIQGLVRQIARWAVASQQDKSPMISVLHANYAAGYLQALELIATDNEINSITNFAQLRSKVYETQDKAVRKVFISCPNYIGQDIDKELAILGINSKEKIISNK